MPGWNWIRTHRKTVASAALGAALLVAVALEIFWFGWDWKALIGWKALVDYINPENATGRKDAVQVYAVIVAGLVAAITAAVGLLNLRLTRKNLEQQRELETQRAQGTALQAYYGQIGKLLTEYDLLTTDREEIRVLARGQTLTVLQEVDGTGKRSLLAFLHGAGLLGADNPAVVLVGADLESAYLKGANLEKANLQRTKLWFADLRDAMLLYTDLRGADLRGADLRGATLWGADLRKANLWGADLRRAKLVHANLREAYLRAPTCERL